MQLEDYFTFLAPNDIRLRGHRIGIETILYEYIHRGRTAEQIAAEFDTLTLEEIYATLLFYHRNERQVTDYLTAWLEHGVQARREQAQDPTAQRSWERLRRARDQIRVAQNDAVGLPARR
jgi:uncharacterized protein (DUF433 family)